MQIVIDMPEDRFRDIQRIASVQLKGRFPTVQQLIANGTPLPEGHGQLIDADALDETLKNGEARASKERKHVLASAINNIRGNLRCADTIIEADKRREEQNESYDK